MSERQMEDRVWYDFKTPVEVFNVVDKRSRIFRRVRCDYQHSANEYCVTGVADGETEEYSFVLKFSKNGKIIPQRSENQNPTPKLRIVR